MTGTKIERPTFSEPSYPTFSKKKLPSAEPAELIALRKTLGLPRVKMAELFGVDERSYRRWEYGERHMPGPAVQLMRFLKPPHAEEHSIITPS